MKKASTEKTYKYPFGVYSEGRLIDVSSYGFVDGQDYTEKESQALYCNTDIMSLQNQWNTIISRMTTFFVVTGKQHRKG